MCSSGKKTPGSETYAGKEALKQQPSGNPVDSRRAVPCCTLLSALLLEEGRDSARCTVTEQRRVPPQFEKQFR